jgi:hypothetical protein
VTGTTWCAGASLPRRVHSLSTRTRARQPCADLQDRAELALVGSGVQWHDVGRGGLA